MKYISFVLEKLQNILAAVMVILAVLMALYLFANLAGCGGEVPAVPEPPPESSGPVYFNEDDGQFYQGQPGGSLPIGYNQRQCQWDACGGPLPDRQQQFKDPVRE